MCNEIGFAWIGVPREQLYKLIEKPVYNASGENRTTVSIEWKAIYNVSGVTKLILNIKILFYYWDTLTYPISKKIMFDFFVLNKEWWIFVWIVLTSHNPQIHNLRIAANVSFDISFFKLASRKCGVRESFYMC